MSPSSRKNVALVVALNVATAALLAYAFAGDQLQVWLTSQPWALVILLTVGAALSFAGATAPQFLAATTQQLSKLARTACDGIFGLIIGLLAGACGFLVATSSLWGLLVWFFFGSVAMSIYYSAFPRRAASHG